MCRLLFDVRCLCFVFFVLFVMVGVFFGGGGRCLVFVGRCLLCVACCLLYVAW